MAIPTMNELTLLHDNICQAVGDPRRMQILYAVNDERRNVTGLAEELQIPQPTVSRHLAVLRQRGLVIAERDSSAVYYRLADVRIIEVMDVMRHMMRDIFGRKATAVEASELAEAGSTH